MSIIDFVGNARNHNINLLEEKKLGCEGVNVIYIKDFHTDINIIPTSENDIRIQFYGLTGNNQKPDFYLTVDSQNGNVTIKVKSNKTLFLIKGNNRLDVYIPQDYSNNLKIETSEGTTNIGSISLHQLEVKSTSGHILLKDTTAYDSKLNNTSGKIDVSGFLGNVVAKNSSGGIRIDYNAFCENELNLKSSSGSIKLQLPNGSAFNLSAKALSGKVECKFPVESEKRERNSIIGIINGGMNKITIESGSGNISIEQR